MTKIRLLLLLGVFAMWPSTASAQRGFWDWIEGLSGPGPFHGYSFGYRLFCTKEFDGRDQRLYNVDPRCFNDGDPNIRQMIDIRFGRFSSNDNPRFASTPSDPQPDRREVELFKLEPSAAVRLNPMLDVGIGLGFVRFSGEGFESFWRTTLTPLKVSIAPLALRVPPNVRGKWSRLIKLHYDVTYFPEGFTGADFGNTKTTYSTASDWARSFGVELDFGVLFSSN